MLQPEKILFETRMTATGGRDGRAQSPDGSFTLALSLPKALGGPGGDGTNPEQLFAAGYAACFLGAVKLVARTRKIALADDTAVSATVGIGPVPAGYALAVELAVSLPGIDAPLAKDIVAAAHERCPYSNATRGNIDVKLTVI
ncbi:organic hydroperoxide resistance protein [Rhizobium sp. SL86]|uniref:organic hydroperoxide resistance protein n=1 Tax=Rhizobium sp. SL86 TaxID=2995148 RepID=UPI0022734AEE|nr:organic hydroperoxide resistance protein [Rhizobium sp. SL86]MCY1667521.1 organic hydroperoxide resistance protein [Rhizobium sp. SL86]